MRQHVDPVRALVLGVGVVVVAVLVVVAWLLWPSAEGVEEHGTDAHLEQADPYSSPAGAATAAMGRIFSWEPSAQEGPWDSLAAAAPYLTGTLAEGAQTRPENEPLPNEWFAWAESADVVIGATEVTSEQVDGDTGVVEVTLRQVVRHRDGGTTPRQEEHLVVDVTDTAEGWKAANYRFTAAGQ